MTAHVKQEKGSDIKNGENTAQVSTSKRTRSYESRKIRKPLMEKKRRARINESLNELKRILLEANGGAPAKKEGSRPFKLEKADILECTVKHLQALHNNRHQNVNIEESAQSNLDKKKPVLLSTNVSSTSISDTDDDNSSNRVLLNSHGLKIDTNSTPTTTAHNPDNLTLSHNNNFGSNNIEVEAPFIHGFSECIRLVQNAMKTMTSSKVSSALEDKLKSHLALLSRDQGAKLRQGRVESRESLMSVDDIDIGFGSGDEHETMTLRSSDSPASISQLSPVSVSSASNNWADTSTTIPCSEVNRPGTVLIPTRMSNGELAFVLKCREQSRLIHGQNKYNQGVCCGDMIDTAFNKSFGYTPRGYLCDPTFTADNHLDISNSRVWRPW